MLLARGKFDGYESRPWKIDEREGVTHYVSLHDPGSDRERYKVRDDDLIAAFSKMELGKVITLGVELVRFDGKISGLRVTSIQQG